MSRISLVPLYLLAGAASAQQVTYQRSGDDWIRSEGEFSYKVDPSVVTVKTGLERDVPAILRTLTGELAGARMVRENRLGFRDIEIPPAVDVLAFVSQLRASGEFELVEENTIGTYGVAPVIGGSGIPSDPMFNTQWNLHNTGQTGGSNDADVDAVEAWTNEDGDPSVVVAVADSGTNWNHEDLIGNIWMNSAETLNGNDSDANGYIDDIRGWDFDSNDNNPTGSFWHGTSVASVIASRGENGVGLVGLAGGGQDGNGVSVMCLNVGAFAPIASVLDDAILYAADNGAHIITMSLSIGTSSAVEAAIDVADAAGLFIDCAAGNGGFPVSYPANLPKVMAVASTNDNDFVSNFSNPGPEVEVAAPGEDIPMCELGNTAYHTNSGTSFAAPHVAALAALILSVDPSMSAADVRQLIIDTAEDIGPPGVDNGSGAGRINANAAIENVNQGFAVAFGTGTLGSNGVPRIRASTIPTVNASIDIIVISALAGAPALLGFSPMDANLAVFGGTVYVDPTAGFLVFVVTVGGGGTASKTLSIPNNPAFLGLERYAQWFVVDAGGPSGLALSDGMHLLVGM